MVHEAGCWYQGVGCSVCGEEAALAMFHHHAPDLALPHPRVPGLEAGDEEAALAGVILGGGDAAVLPHAAAAHRVDGLVRGLPQADGGGDGGGALQPHRVARAGDNVGRVRGHSEARAPHSLQQGNG